MSQVIFSTLRSRNIPIHPSVFKPSSLRRLFPSDGTLRPNTLTLALFPHLHSQPYSIALTGYSVSRISITSPARAATSASLAFIQTLQGVARVCRTVATLPVDLARGECTFKHKELARIRDERAEMLGMLVDLRDRLASALETKGSDEALFALAQFAHYLQAVLGGEEVRPFGADSAMPGDVLQSLSSLANIILPSHTSMHRAEIRTGQLKRPSRLTLLWPQLVLLPPLALYAIRTAYVSRASLEELAKDALETAKGFWEDWVLEPLRGIVRTVRAGRDDGVIVTKESVRADLDVSPCVGSDGFPSGLTAFSSE